MANNFFSKSIQVVAGFALSGSSPLDARTVVDSVSDLNSMDELLKYEGLTVYVTADKSNYQLIDNVWVKQVKPSDLQALGYGDMLKSVFATNAKASQGYVDKAIMSDRATTATNADNATKLDNHTSDYFATATNLDLANTTIKGLQDSIGEITDGTIKVDSAANADHATSATTATEASAAVKLKTARTFTLSGDVNASNATFDGTANVTLTATLKNIITAGTGCKVTVNAKGLVTKVEALAVTDIPTLTSSKISDLGTAATKNVGTASGNVVVVKSDGKIDESILPSIAITDTFIVENEAGMLASAAQKGDICIRNDLNKTFILKDSNPATLSSWTELRTPTDAVLSVNGKTGALTLTTSDIAEGNRLYYTEARFNASFANKIAATPVTSLQNGSKVITTDDEVVINGGNA